MAKRSRETIWERRVRILADVIDKKVVPISEVEHSTGKTKGTIRSDIEELKSLGIPVELSGDNIVMPAIGIEGLWEGTVVGKRFRSQESMAVKRRLAAAVVNYCKGHKGSIHSILFGNGTTVYVCAAHILASQPDLNITAVYTSSVLVFHALAESPLPEFVEIVGGQLDRDILWLHNDQSIDELRRKPIDAVVTSFMSISENGFWTKESYEVAEKLMNLKPHRRCRFALIPLEWSKFGPEVGTLVAPNGGKGEDAFDLRDGPKYVIFTNAPDTARDEDDKRRFAVKDRWENNGVEIITVP